MSSRIEQLLSLAQEFENASFKTTASEIRSLASVIPSSKSIQDLQVEFQKVEGTFGNEWNSGTQQKQEIGRFVFPVLAPVIQDPRTITVINSLASLFESRRKSEDTIRQIASLFRAGTNPYQRFLLLCFTYVMAFEGVFDETARFILILAGISRRQTISYSDIAELSYSVIRTRLEAFDQDLARVIFEGHENHLRNSIAHGRFSYQAARDTMIFEDLDPRTMTVSWGPVEMNFATLLDSYYQKIEDTSTFVTFLIGMLQARGLAYTEVNERLGATPGS
jgi:hypothetical protein